MTDDQNKERESNPEKSKELTNAKKKEEQRTEDSSTEEEIQDFQTFNPLYDFKLIRGRFYAIQSIPVRRVTEVVNKKTGETEIKWITTWKTYYSDESGCIQRMENEKIEGETIQPEFSAEIFLEYRKSLLHRNRSIQPAETTIAKVYKYTKNVISKILTLNDNDLSLLSCWIIAAHFNRVFAQFPPLIFGKAGSDAGGTTALMTTSLIPYPISVYDPTEATLFRLSQYGFSLLIDEIDPDENNRSKIGILNLILDGSFSKSATIPRATGKDFSVQSFASYGPKVLVDPYMALTRPSTLSRSIRIWIKRDPNKSVNLEQKEFISERQYLIDFLYSLFLPYAHSVRKAYDSVNDFVGRERQAYAPVLAIANIVGCHDQVIRALRPSAENLALARENDPFKFVLFALYDYLKMKGDDITELGTSKFKQSRDKSTFSIEFSDLRKELSDLVSEVHQTDATNTSDYYGSGTTTRKREWRKIPAEFRQFFESTKFNQIIKNALPDHVAQVRGNKWGLRINAVNKKMKNRREVDPILDELEKILRIGEGQSYRKDINQGNRMAEFETEEEAPIRVEDDDDLDDILG